MLSRNYKFTGLLVSLWLVLVLLQIHEHAGVNKSSAQRVRKNERIEPRNDRPWETPVAVGYMKTKFGVHAISALGQKDVWVLASEGRKPEYRPQFVLIRSSDGGASWSKNQLDVGSYYFTVNFVSRLVGWIVGADGLIRKSTDGGLTWSRQETPSESDLLFIQFLDARRGWAAGDDGELLRTTDGGGTWLSNKLQGHGWVGHEFRGWLNKFQFTDSRYGWFVGDDSKVFYTTTGGKKWQSRTRAVERCVGKRSNQKLDVTDVHFFDSKRGILLIDLIDKVENGDWHQGFVLRTRDGGLSWTKTWEPSRGAGWEMQGGPFHRLNFSSETEGWITAEFGRGLYHTTDGGHSWQSQFVSGVDPDDLISGGIGSLLMVDARLGWGSVNLGDYPLLDKVVRTTDGGRTWRDVALTNEH